MRRLGAFCLLAVAGFAGPATSARGSEFSMSQIYTIDAGHSYVGFKIKYMGFAKVRGRFSEVIGAIRYDESNPALTSATVRIAVESLDTDHEWRDKDLKSDQWFDAQAFPYMSFMSTRTIATDRGFDLVGDLTIRGVKQEVRLVMEEFSGLIQDVRQDSQVVFVGHTQIDRKAFGVMGDRWSQVKEGIVGVDSTVEVELTVLGKRVNAPNFRNRIKDPERPPGKVYSVLRAEGVGAGLATFESLLAQDPDAIHEGMLDAVGHLLLKEGRTDDALTVFRRNCELFPDASGLHASLAEAYGVRGDFGLAKESYEFVLRKDPAHVVAREVLRHLN